MEQRIMECVPNFSEGRNEAVIQRIAGAFQYRPGVKLLSCSSDYDHNRTVITAIGEAEALRRSVVEAIGVAAACIDLRFHRGVHPRMGAADVVPFIPLRGYDMREAVALSRKVGEEVARRFAIPCFLYECAATAKNRVNLADIRSGQFEGMNQKMRQPQWKPDFGPLQPHPTAGVTAIGARKPLIAYNVDLASCDEQIAKDIAACVREKNGGLPKVKALGVFLQERSCAQVTMNLTDYEVTGLFEAYEAVETEAKMRGVSLAGSEIIGLIPKAAIEAGNGEKLKLIGFSQEQILEHHF